MTIKVKNKLRFMTIALIAVLTLAFFGCGKSADKDKVAVASAVELLNSVWDQFDEAEKFPVLGGSLDNPVDNAAGEFDLEDVEGLSYNLHLPEVLAENIDEAASLIHAMNAHTFTGAVFHITENTDTEGFVTALKENILNTRWMCGFPDKMMICLVNDEYVVSAFGSEENMENFKGKLTEIYGKSVVVRVEEAIE